MFLYSHEIRDHKMGEKSTKQFFQKHSYSASKKCWENNCWKKVRKNVLYSHNIRDQKIVGKTRETFFPE